MNNFLKIKRHLDVICYPRALASLTFVFVYIQEFGCYILFGAWWSKENQCETTKDNASYFQEHNLQQSSKISLDHAISIILMASKIAEAD